MAIVASPHRIASDVGARVLGEGASAIDAAIATNLALAVLMPYACGLGGDLLALVWDGGNLVGYDGTGRAPTAATPDVVRERAGGNHMPHHGPLPVTVPGAVDGWFALLERFGTRSFDDLAAPAGRLAADGFELDVVGRGAIAASLAVHGHQPTWAAVYAQAAETGRLHQPGIARTLTTLGTDGPDAYYRGEIARAITASVQEQGGVLASDDLRSHSGRWVPPLQHPYRGRAVCELPPPTQGVTALQAFAILEARGDLPPAGVDRTHLLLEATKLAMVERRDHVGDPAAMVLDPASDLLAPERITGLAARIDPGVAAHPDPARPVPGGTVYLTVADDRGQVVSLSQSNFMGFGSGLTVPGWGINLHNRGAYFRLDGIGVDQLAPGRQPLHTLIPAMVLEDGRPWLSFGTMGGDNQVGIQLQLLTAIADDGADPQAALDAPRWSLSAEDWSVDVEESMPVEVVAGLRTRGHQVREIADHAIGWAQAIRFAPDGMVGASDPRSPGAVRHA